MALSTTIRKPNRMSHVAVFRRKMSGGAEWFCMPAACVKNGPKRKRRTSGHSLSTDRSGSVDRMRSIARCSQNVAIDFHVWWVNIYASGMFTWRRTSALEGFCLLVMYLLYRQASLFIGLIFRGAVLWKGVRKNILKDFCSI